MDKKITKIVKTLPPNAQDYFHHVCEIAESNNVRILISDKLSLSYGDATNTQVNGYFEDGNKPTLAVAIGKPFNQWFTTFVHEACHMDQWLEKIPEWTNMKCGNVDGYDLLNLWLVNEIELTKKQFDKICYQSYCVELDCEKRAVQDIINHELPLDVNTYIQKANSYVYFYPMMWYIRSWYLPTFEPYNIEEIWTNMPKEFQEDYTNVPEKIRLIYIRSIINSWKGKITKCMIQNN